METVQLFVSLTMLLAALASMLTVQGAPYESNPTMFLMHSDGKVLSCHGPQCNNVRKVCMPDGKFTLDALRSMSPECHQQMQQCLCTSMPITHPVMLMRRSDVCVKDAIKMGDPKDQNVRPYIASEVTEMRDTHLKDARPEQPDLASGYIVDFKDYEIKALGVMVDADTSVLMTKANGEKGPEKITSVRFIRNQLGEATKRGYPRTIFEPKSSLFPADTPKVVFGEEVTARFEHMHKQLGRKEVASKLIADGATTQKKLNKVREDLGTLLKQTSFGFRKSAKKPADFINMQKALFADWPRPKEGMSFPNGDPALDAFFTSPHGLEVLKFFVEKLTNVAQFRNRGPEWTEDYYFPTNFDYSANDLLKSLMRSNPDIFDGTNKIRMAHVAEEKTKSTINKVLTDMGFDITVAPKGTKVFHFDAKTDANVFHQLIETPLAKLMRRMWKSFDASTDVSKYRMDLHWFGKTVYNIDLYYDGARMRVSAY